MTRRRWRTGLVAAATAALVTAGAAAVNALANAEVTPTTYSFFAAADTSTAVPDPDTASVELGLRFTSTVAGAIDAVRFFKAPGDSGSHRVNVWSSTGTNLATAVSTSETASGWQQAALPQPIAITAGNSYVVSYHTSRYVATSNYFTRAVQSGPLTAGPSSGVYAYGSGGFPAQAYNAANYWVDLAFTATTTAAPSPSPTGNLARIPWEGGPSYYARFPSAAAWNNPNFFPIGVWFESVLSTDDIAKDKAAGINTYVELTSNSDATLIRNAGMYALPSDLPGAGSETVGDLLTDEADMNYGAGWDAWSGEEGWNTCQPIQDQGGKCGYTVMQHFSDAAARSGRMRYANYGKGVMMWESDQEAQVFINQFQELASADMYFYTDNNLCPTEAQNFLGIPPQFCRRSSSYGLVLDRLRALDGLDGKRKPIYGFVEDGHPFTESNWPTITGDQIAGAVMNSLIHEARGIIYFNHNFGGACHSQHVLRDNCGAAVRPKVTETNQRITTLAPVLNTQSYQYSFNTSLDTMLKRYDGSYYVFAMPGRTGGTGAQTLTLPSGVSASSVEVLFEDRSVAVTGGRFTDTFANEYTYHVYKITP
ncbi:DUF4082 domain-containing protein [Dactylosporangium matsuzakiense]|uniref:DUF4082 domain-containing protein n=1 Tax=Dactylosporangium matsuzakiense TaxID=53360 RepID=A0A9W6NJ00_9ACTN|nr:DUF4082 domain-containing protein [Dactylosporangium matsuzakiense]UWZ45302.1 DUF4082 domain-containing protein [Dactylosporangium matsuzakiense]GLK98723.1 hypothetical protein GCM10017581_004640 [Dactylosporangium matsuzakiense]